MNQSFIVCSATNYRNGGPLSIMDDLKENPYFANAHAIVWDSIQGKETVQVYPNVVTKETGGSSPAVSETEQDVSTPMVLLDQDRTAVFTVESNGEANDKRSSISTIGEHNGRSRCGFRSLTVTWNTQLIDHS